METECPHGESVPFMCPPCQTARKVMGLPPDEDVSDVFRARYRGSCVACPRPVEQGMMIRRVRFGDKAEYIHDSCWEG